MIETLESWKYLEKQQVCLHHPGNTILWMLYSDVKQKMQNRLNLHHTQVRT